MIKKHLIRVLIGANLILAAALFLAHVPLQRAFAQDNPPLAPALSGRYLAVAGETQDEFDVVYLLDTKERTVHVLMYDRSRRRLNYSAFRDLDLDFRNNG